MKGGGLIALKNFGNGAKVNSHHFALECRLFEENLKTKKMIVTPTFHFNNAGMTEQQLLSHAR